MATPRSRILVYTQTGVIGGSLRLLLHLATHLQQQADVVLSVPDLDEPGLHVFLPQFPSVTICAADAITHQKFDVLVGHFPFGLDHVATMDIPRKILVTMEIMSVFEAPFDNGNAHMFDCILYLHDDQVAHLSLTLRDKLCRKMQIINNVDAAVASATTVITGNIGCVGGNHKHDLSQLLRVARHGGFRQMLVYGNLPAPRFRRSQHGSLNYYLWRYLHWRKKICWLGPRTDLANVYASFDCLLHTPAHGNGTSVVVSDALSCGKIVVLSPLPEHKQEYRHVNGIYFTDEIQGDVSGLMKSYNFSRASEIAAAYHAHYNRSQVLDAWSSAILN